MNHFIWEPFFVQKKVGETRMPEFAFLRILYIVFIVLSIPIYLVLGTKIFQKYRKAEQIQTLAFSLLFIFAGLGALCLFVEQVLLEVSFSSLVEYPLGHLPQLQDNFIAQIARILVSLAILFSAIAVFASVVFSLSFLDPHWMKISYPIAVVEVIYTLAYFLLPYHWIRKPDIWEYSHLGADLLILFLFLLPVWSSPILFGYIVVSLRKAERHIFARTVLLALGQLVIAVGYTFQVLSPNILTGFLIFYYPLHMYFCFIMPEWFKKYIGWPSEG